MKIYVWEDNGISSAWHDDGTLVVLAESPEHARRIVRANQEREKQIDEEIAAVWVRFRNGELTERGKKIKINKLYEQREKTISWDGTDEALNRKPDREYSLDEAAVIAFNGGGYD